MACPRIELRGKKVILLSGFRKGVDAASMTAVIKSADISSAEELQQLATRNPDVVAFGYVAGRWVPAA